MKIIYNKWIRNPLAGALGGGLSGLGWLLITLLTAGLLHTPVFYLALLGYGAVTGLGIGAALGVAEGLVSRSLRLTLLGAAAGFLAGSLGMLLGLVPLVVFGGLPAAVGLPTFVLLFLGTDLLGLCFGGLTGLAQGLTRRSLRGVIAGLLGGAVGGGLGGFLFDLLTLAAGFHIGPTIKMLVFLELPQAPPINYALGFVGVGTALLVLGAFIGLGIAFVERVAVRAWLRVVYGAQEGLDFPLDKARLTIGQSDRCDIRLHSDPQIQPRHAVVRREGEVFVVEAEPGAVVLVNKETVAQAVLQPDDQLTIGRTRLRYRGPGGVAPIPLSFPPPGSGPGSLGSPPRPQPASLHAPTIRDLPPAALCLVDAAGRRYPLAADWSTIGSAPGNTIVIPAPGVAPYHAEVRREGQHLVLYDRGVGVLVNGRPVQGRNMIRAGFTVRLGSVEFTVSS